MASGLYIFYRLFTIQKTLRNTPEPAQVLLHFVACM